MSRSKSLLKFLHLYFLVAILILTYYWLRNYPASQVSMKLKAVKPASIVKHTHQGTKVGVTGPTIQTPRAEDNATWNSEIQLTPMESMLWKPKTDDVNLKVIFIRIPKTGSRTLEALVLHQLRRKGFRYIQVKQSKDEGNKRTFFTNQKGKVLFAGHTRHIEFQWSSPPVYISLSRDPVERFKSNFYYSFYGDKGNAPWTIENMKLNRAAMAESRGGNTTIPTLSECILKEMPFCMEYRKLYASLLFFCGYDPRCSNLSEWTYNQAVKHVNGALAVGVAEEFGEYLRVIERLAPGLFNNISESESLKAAKISTEATKSTMKKLLTSEAEEKLRKLMKMEYRIYNYIKDRFHQIKTKLLI